MFCRGFSVEFLARQASKTPNVPSNKAPVVKLQLSSAQRHPAPGYRDAGYYKGFGAVRNVGTHGYSWSSSIAGANAHNLGFSYSWLTPQNSNYRAYGFPLRCLQE